MLPEQPPLDAQSQSLLKEIMRPGVTIEAVIPKDPSPNELWAFLSLCAQGTFLLESRLERIKPIIGKVLLMFQEKPSLYKDLGYETFEEFRREGVGKKLGLSRTTLWETQVIARDWPQLLENPDRYNKIRRSKLNILKSFSTGRDNNSDALLRLAEKMSSTELRQYCEQRGFISPGETLPATIVIQSSLDIAQRWKLWAQDGRIHSIVGSSQPDKILDAMMEECMHGWIEQHEDNEREQQNAIENGTSAGTSLPVGSED